MLEPAADLVEGWVEERVVSAAALLIARGDEVLVERYWGVADLHRNVAATENTLWSIASITKPGTAAAFMSCVDRGGLDLDMPVAGALPGVARLRRPWRRDGTPRPLPTHTCGPAGFD